MLEIVCYAWQFLVGIELHISWEQFNITVRILQQLKTNHFKFVFMSCPACFIPEDSSSYSTIQWSTELPVHLCQCFDWKLSLLIAGFQIISTFLWMWEIV